jgi:hypothetical protein
MARSWNLSSRVFRIWWRLMMRMHTIINLFHVEDCDLGHRMERLLWTCIGPTLLPDDRRICTRSSYGPFGGQLQAPCCLPRWTALVRSHRWSAWWLPSYSMNYRLIQSLRLQHKQCAYDLSLYAPSYTNFFTPKSPLQGNYGGINAMEPNLQPSNPSRGEHRSS